MTVIYAQKIIIPEIRFRQVNSQHMNKPGKSILFLFFLTIISASAMGQMITGTWRGKINRQKVEVKIIQNGDSLTGTSYYYESANNYRRYSIKGYFDERSNAAIWWDDQLIEEKSGRFSIGSPGKIPLLSRADFNCPGDGRMMLDGTAGRKTEPTRTDGDLHLDKSDRTTFEDEWDYVIDNYTAGTNDPDIIDSIAAIAGRPPVIAKEPEPVVEKPVVKTSPPVVVKEEPVITKPVEKPARQPEKTEKTTPPPVITAPPVAKAPTIQEKFVQRQKTFIKEIPVPANSDSIELRFYDNAEIDGDSISIFLNGSLLKEHIRLTANAYSFKLAVSDLKDANELIMVAENMGAIPPNTSYMVAIVNGNRHDAYLSSTEGSSAMIRFVKAPDK